MAVRYEFTFALGAEVSVKAFDTTGVVVSVQRDLCSAETYRVIYYLNNERRDQWFYQFELSNV